MEYKIGLCLGAAGSLRKFISDYALSTQSINKIKAYTGIIQSTVSQECVGYFANFDDDKFNKCVNEVGVERRNFIVGSLDGLVLYNK